MAGTSREIALSFRSGGAIITTLGAGPDGKIYGSTAHPMHFFSHDPRARAVTDYGAIKAIGGGNIWRSRRKTATWPDRLILGHFLSFSIPPGLSPRMILSSPIPGSSPDSKATSPCACLAHPDGMHVIAAGFMDYGRTGGGLGIVNLVDRRKDAANARAGDSAAQHPHTQGPAVGRSRGRTSVLTPGGGHSAEQVGVLYLMDWARLEVIFQTVPVPGAAEVFSLEVGADGLAVRFGHRLAVFCL